MFPSLPDIGKALRPEEYKQWLEHSKNHVSDLCQADPRVSRRHATDKAVWEKMESERLMSLRRGDPSVRGVLCVVYQDGKAKQSTDASETAADGVCREVSAYQYREPPVSAVPAGVAYPRLGKTGSQISAKPGGDCSFQPAEWPCICKQSGTYHRTKVDEQGVPDWKSNHWEVPLCLTRDLRRRLSAIFD